MRGLSVLVPCLNEAANLAPLVERLHAALQAPAFAPAEIVLVDDGSSDDTRRRFGELATRFQGVRGLHHDRPRGIPAAWRTGHAAARGEWICTIDADLQYQPEEIPRLWQAMHDSGADIVQGARSDASRTRDLRFVLSKGLGGLLNRTFGMSLRDNKSAFFMCRREVLASLLGYRERYRHWQCFVMVAAHHHGYRIHEVDTPFAPRRGGRSAFGRLALGPALGVAFDFVPALKEYGRKRA
jgi:glycosyltransferase involved in cell wall biosynthesis